MSTSNLAVGYPSADGQRFPAVESINLEITQGEFVALIGPSGCGKSTLLKYLAGIGQGVRTSGAHIVNGIEQAHELAYMFQTPALLDWKNNLENVMLPLTLAGMKKAEAKERAEHLLELVGLRNHLVSSPFHLSGGMKQRVALARALVSGPRLLLMDEPFGALDAITRDAMCILLQDLLIEQPATVVLVTHSIDEAVLLSDRVLVMSSGPGTLMNDIPVPIRRPRTLDHRQEPIARSAIAAAVASLTSLGLFDSRQTRTPEGRADHHDS